MKKLIILTFFLTSGICYSQDSIKFGGLDVDSIVVDGSTVWVKVEAETDTFTTVTIGTQTWMKYNLHITDYGAGIYSYNNDAEISDEYGYLYTWDAAMRMDTDIVGWHIPTLEEWETLGTYLGGNSVAGGKMKEAGTTHWTTPNTGADNSSGFTGIGAGYIENYTTSTRNKLSLICWSSTYETDEYTIVYRAGLGNNTAALVIGYSYAGFGDNYYAYSVRMIKD